MQGYLLLVVLLRKGEHRNMGMFVNPDNSAFQVALNSEIYVDKTAGLLSIQTEF